MIDSLFLFMLRRQYKPQNHLIQHFMRSWSHSSSFIAMKLPLIINVFQLSLSTGNSSTNWFMANAAPTYKKDNSNWSSDYCPIIYTYIKCAGHLCTGLLTRCIVCLYNEHIYMPKQGLNHADVLYYVSLMHSFVHPATCMHICIWANTFGLVHLWQV